MIEAEKNKDYKALLDEVVQVGSFNELLKNVSVNKDRIFALWKKKEE